MDKKLGDTLKGLRIRNKLTQAQLAEKLEITDKTLSRYEKGDATISVEVLERYSKIFDIPIKSLIEGNIESKKNISKNKKILFLLLILVIVILVSLLIYVLSNNSKDYLIYDLSSVNDTYKVSGLIARSKKNDYIIINELEDYSDLIKDDEIYSYEYALVVNDITIYQPNNISYLEKEEYGETAYIYDILSQINFKLKYDINKSEFNLKKVDNNFVKLVFRYLDKNLNLKTISYPIELVKDS